MSLSKKIVKRVLTGALAVSMIAGTSVSAAAAVAVPDTDGNSVASAKFDQIKEIIKNYLAEKFPKEEIKALIQEYAQKIGAYIPKEKIEALIDQIMQEVVQYIPEETMQEIQQIIAVVSQDDFPQQMAQSIISDVLDTVYKEYLKAEDLADQIKMAVKVLAGKAKEAAAAEYAKLPEEVREKISDTLMKVKMLAEAIKEKASKYYVSEGYLYLTEDDYTYCIMINPEKGIEAIAVRYSGEDEKIIIPSTADSIPVTSASLSADNTVTAVTIPETFTKVDALSFMGLPSLKYIYVNKNNPYFKSANGIVTDKAGSTLVAVPSARKYSPSERITAIGEFAYAGSFMNKINIPSTVTSIGKSAFLYCINLSEITIPESVTEIQDFTFAGCMALSKVVVPSTVTSIADNAFAGINTDAVFYCENNTDYAVKYAEDHGFKVVSTFDADFDGTSITLLGASAVFSAQGKYSEGDYQYAFYYRQKGTEKWKTKQKYSANNSITMTPGYTNDYEVCVKVKNAKGEVIEKIFDWKVIQTANNKSSIVQEGNIIKTKCKAVDKGTTFSVYYKKAADSDWITVQPYEKNKFVDIEFAEPGDYNICIKAKSRLGFISKKYFDVTVDEAEITVE